MGDRDQCEHFIPLTRGDLTDLLCSEKTLSEADRDFFRTVCDLTAAIYHVRYHRRLQQLKAAYASFDPDSDAARLIPLTNERKQARLNELYQELTTLLVRARFTHLRPAEVAPAWSRASDWGVRMDVDFRAFEHAALFVRGDTFQIRTRRRLWNFYRLEEIETPVYRRLVLVLKLRKHPRLPGVVDTESVYLKVFKDIPKQDVLALMPGARVRLNAWDRGQIGLPLLSGIALTAWNLMREASLTVEAILLSPNALWGLAAAAFGYGYKSYYSYLQTRRKYHLTLTQSLYFQNLDSNAGVLTRLLDEAEEQECLAAILAYFCLWRYGGAGWTRDDLGLSMELFLDRYTGLTVACTEADELDRLRQLGLAEPAGDGRWRALPPSRAVETLHEGLIHFIPRPRAEAGERGASAS